MSADKSPGPRVSSDLLSECAAYLRARLEVERYVFVPREARASASPAEAVNRVPAFVRSLPTTKTEAGRAPASSTSSPGANSALVSAAEERLPPSEYRGATGRRPSVADADAAHASITTESSADRLERFHAEIKDCLECSLGHTRTKFVFGVGNPSADLMLIGEAPGREEDLQGVPFVGAAGELLTKILAAINLRREDVYIANVLKCRPPGNRDPEPHEVESCRPYVEEQIRIVAPRLIVALGRFAAHLLTGRTASLTQLRSENHEWRGIPVIPTYHPSALLRYPTYKRPTWEDMKRVRAELDRLAATPRPGAGAGPSPRTGASRGDHSETENATRAEIL
jgi:uracil-DNA glycosylase